jgi:hypothetical protein
MQIVSVTIVQQRPNKGTTRRCTRRPTVRSFLTPFRARVNLVVISLRAAWLYAVQYKSMTTHRHEKTQLLKRQIEQAFADVQSPDGERLLDFDRNHCEECAEDYDYDMEAFAGKHWKELSSDFMDTHARTIRSFTPEAFHFYLPAYLIASLDNPESEAADYLLTMLKPPELWEETAVKSEFAHRIGVLTEEQTQAIRSFIHFLKDEYSENFHNDWMQWMLDFWP